MKLEKVLEKFEEYCMQKHNLTYMYERHGFFTKDQLMHESVCQYATELRCLAQSCEFSELKEKH